MSFKDYVNHIVHKHRLSIAIAVIRTKPNHMTTEKYIEHLKNKINYENMDSDDLDITMFSDDFKLDDNDDNDIIKDGNVINYKGDMMNDTQAVHSIAILQDFDNLERHVINIDNAEPSTMSDVIYILKEVDDKSIEKIVGSGNVSQSTYCDSLQTQFLVASNTECSTDIDANFAESLPSKELNTNSFRIHNDGEIKAKEKVDANDLSQLFDGSDETEIYNVHGYTQNYTHYSASQQNNITIDNKYIFGVDRTENRNEDLLGNIQSCRTNDCEILNENDLFSQNAQNMYVYLQDSQHINGIPYKDYNENITPNDSNAITNVKNAVEDTDNMPETTDSQREVVSFKVIGELNKIKTFLNRKVDRKASGDGHSSDSGYRSDSQSKYSLKSLQTGTWLNQSAHCLLTHITQCPLAASTKEITNEISVVLGQLIDRLHEEEKYPSFLEELLETVDLLLRLIYEEGSCSDDVLLKKDETIQRLFLINKSLHILKYTIEKITYILQNIYTKISEDTSCEITYINEMENVCYIFYILEVILQKYNMKKQDLSSQTSTQPSQDEDKFPKKSNITDIWRRKWNPNYKETVSQENSEKKCVITNCSLILNKIIVGCMEGYSLLAYAALKCFNLMQS